MEKRTYHEEKRVLPQYPRTPHLPHKPNTQREDLVASDKEVACIFTSTYVVVEEKIDGANVGMAKFDGHPIIRNHNYILNKGYQKQTPAKLQFKSIWTWYYKHEHLFDKLADLAGPVSVYGEWMIAQHGLEYDLLPSWFIAFDVYNYEEGKFMNPMQGSMLLKEVGFCTVPQLLKGTVDNYEQLEAFCQQPSPFTTKGLREGLYVKVSDEKWIIDRFKMVREGFKQGGLWSTKEIKKNQIKKDTNND